MRPNDDSSSRLGTRAERACTSAPPSKSVSISSASSVVSASGTSWLDSSRFCAVTVISSTTAGRSPGSSASSAAGGAGGSAGGSCASSRLPEIVQASVIAALPSRRFQFKSTMVPPIVRKARSSVAPARGGARACSDPAKILTAGWWSGTQ